MAASLSYFAARRLLIEGPGDVDSGAWPISWFRIAKGWGELPETYWPQQKNVHGMVMPNEPHNADDIAKRHRLFNYQRLRSEYECTYALFTDRITSVALEIGKAWNRKNAPKGRIDLNSPHPPSLVHSIPLMGFDFDAGEFIFPNSWGEEWGDKGMGYLPFGYLSRFMVEGWTAPAFSQQIYPPKPGIDMHMRRGEPTKLGIPSVFEVYDGDTDTMAGWALAVQKPDVAFDIEDFFIRPDYRRRGLGTDLAKGILKIQPSVSDPIRFWIPWGDHEERNAPALLAWAKKLGLRLQPSGVRWAAYMAEAGAPVDSLPQLEWIPAKATGPLHLLEDDGDVSVLEHGVTSDWTDEMADRRAELVEQKYRSSLTDEENAELAELQKAFGKYQDSIAPLPPH